MGSAIRRCCVTESPAGWLAATCRSPRASGSFGRYLLRCVRWQHSVPAGTDAREEEAARTGGKDAPTALGVDSRTGEYGGGERSALRIRSSRFEPASSQGRPRRGTARTRSLTDRLPRPRTQRRRVAPRGRGQFDTLAHKHSVVARLGEPHRTIADAVESLGRDLARAVEIGALGARKSSACVLHVGHQAGEATRSGRMNKGPTVGDVSGAPPIEVALGGAFPHAGSDASGGVRGVHSPSCGPPWPEDCPPRRLWSRRAWEGRMLSSHRIRLVGPDGPMRRDTTRRNTIRDPIFFVAGAAEGLMTHSPVWSECAGTLTGRRSFQIRSMFL